MVAPSATDFATTESSPRAAHISSIAPRLPASTTNWVRAPAQ